MYFVVSNLAGYLYPAYASFKAVKTNDVQSIMSWLIYWIVMALFSVGEDTADKFVAILLRNKDDIHTVVDPSTNSAAILYESFVVPTLTRHEKEIDTALGMAHEQATNKGAELGKQGLSKLYQAAVEGLVKTGFYTSDTSTNQPSPNSTPNSNGYIKEYIQQSSLRTMLFRRSNS
ncbi:8638_t:CDS:2 [Scutellospora calospora]|uniref:8638_t:CDS:1 n=1 Tax=Scutellospora calospora TaxID=85575 RepID=A0ACA9L2N8_9GLOM|nr:8638_t:CDS:2 [Scutellospora calospora]